MKYYVIAGEASGDLYGARLIEEIKHLDSDSAFKGFGGDLMKEQGAQITKHYRDLAFMGVEQVIMNIRTIFKNIALCKSDITQFSPDVIILIDYPGFNLRIAKWAKTNGYKVYYYIPPTVWAWNVKRVYKIKQYIDQAFVIFPFEKDFYKKYNYDVNFVGHPLLDIINNKPKQSFEVFCKKHHLNNKPIIALLPGSRKQEISAILKPMLSVVDHFPEYQFVIAGAPSLSNDFYNQFITKELPIITNATYELLEQTSAALVTSGTATLETALFNVPQVVCYKTSPLFYRLAKLVIKINYICIVNIIADKKVVTELIQHQLTQKNIINELKHIISEKGRNAILSDYKSVRDLLGSGGASKKTAQLIVNLLAEQ